MATAAGARGVSGAIAPPPPPQSRSAEPVTVYAVEEKGNYDNSLSWFFHGKTYFWFALCVYYLGGVLALTVATTALGMPMVLMIGMGGWAFVDCFFCCGTRKTSTETVANGLPGL